MTRFKDKITIKELLKLEKKYQYKHYSLKAGNMVELYNEHGNMIAEYREDKQFFVWRKRG